MTVTWRGDPQDMFRFFSMSSDRAFGILLFSGAIVLTASKRTGIFSRLSWIKNILHEKDRDGPGGDFIVRSRDQSRKWKDFYSVTTDDEAGLHCELEVKNETDEVLLLCWITPTGKLCNYTVIHDGSIKDNSVSNCHVELASTHHAFVCIRRSKRSPKVLSDVADEVFHLKHLIIRNSLDNLATKLPSSNFSDFIAGFCFCVQTYPC